MSLKQNKWNDKKATQPDIQKRQKSLNDKSHEILGDGKLVTG